MFDNKSNISIDALYNNVKRQDDNIREQWRLYEELRKKVNGLYEKDVHDTERPKVDMLSDDIRSEVWHEIYELKSRIVELEKNK